MSNQTITIRTESDTVEKISSIAQAMDRSRNWVIEDEQAQASLGEGQGIPHEEIMAELSELIDEKIKAYEDNR
jgi:predicted transcriptional regulator